VIVFKPSGPEYILYICITQSALFYSLFVHPLSFKSGRLMLDFYKI
jgi:hypothetical protein